MKLLSETKRHYWVSLPYRATPNKDSLVGAALFKNAKECTEYLNQYTGYTMDREDWKILGKITKWFPSKGRLYYTLNPHNDINWRDYA